MRAPVLKIDDSAMQISQVNFLPPFRNHLQQESAPFLSLAIFTPSSYLYLLPFMGPGAGRSLEHGLHLRPSTFHSKEVYPLHPYDPVFPSLGHDEDW